MCNNREECDNVQLYPLINDESWSTILNNVINKIKSEDESKSNIKTIIPDPSLPKT